MARPITFTKDALPLYDIGEGTYGIPQILFPNEGVGEDELETNCCECGKKLSVYIETVYTASKVTK